MKPNDNDLKIISQIFCKESTRLPFLEAVGKDAIQYDAFVSPNKMKVETHQRVALKFINNVDGTIRWMFPASSKQPVFLSLYNTSTFLGKVRKRILSWMFYLKLDMVYTHKIYLYLSDQCASQIKISNNYALFFGTRGPERKVVVAQAVQGNVPSFLKIPIGERAKSLVNNEFRILAKVNALPLEHVTVPQASKEEGVIQVSNVKNSNSRAVMDIDERHINFLTQMYTQTAESDVLKGQYFFERMQKRVQKLSQEQDALGSQQLVPMMKELLETIDQYAFIPTGLVHGDFTPWNSYVTRKGIQVYDWERGQEKMPLFYDLIHFVVQTGILVKKLSPQSIMEEIKRVFDREEVLDSCRIWHVDQLQLMKLYFIDQFSYLMFMYQTQQEELHPQSYWICETARGLLQAVSDPKESFRRVFTRQLLEDMREEEYVLMKFTEGTIQNIPESSDLDFCISKKTTKKVIAKINNYPYVLKVKLQKKSFMKTMRVYFQDHSFLSIDFIHRFERKSIQILRTKEVLEHAGITPEGVKVPQPKIDFEYKFLFYQLNSADFPQKYMEHYMNLPAGKLKSILFYINDKYDLNYKSIEPLMHHRPELAKKIHGRLLSMPMNNSFSLIRRGVNYLKDVAKQLLTTKGMIITVSGVDGAGKSTFINGLKSELAKKFRHKVVVLRHRPSILPILSVYKYGKEEAHARATAMMPRTGGNTNRITSIIRFAYYFLDYLVGQFYIQLRYVRRGYLVIFDRYYYDFISDPKRTNLALPQEMPKALYRFVLNPDINVLLYADPMMILQRKKELSREDIVKLTKSYLDLFRTYAYKYKSSKFMTIENIDLEKSLSKTIHEYILAS